MTVCGSRRSDVVPAAPAGWRAVKKPVWTVTWVRWHGLCTDFGAHSDGKVAGAKGKPVERRGRKTSGLTALSLRQRGCRGGFARVVASHAITRNAS